MNQKYYDFLKYRSYAMRVSALRMTTQAGSGHLTSALSAADIVAALFFYAMHFDPQNPRNTNNDVFILSKGHAAPILYAVWKELGILSEQELLTYRSFDSQLEGHPTPRFSRTEAATGSLGQGLSIGVGISLIARRDNSPKKTYVLMGDSEISEGSVWEAIQLASYYSLSNLIAIVDCNRLGQSTEVMDNHHINKFMAKFSAFEWQTYTVNGHDIEQLCILFDEIKNTRSHKPIIILAKTLKGYGLESVENKEGFHGKAFSKEQLPFLLDVLEKRFSDEASYQKNTYNWKPTIPVKSIIAKPQTIFLENPSYKKEEKIATRYAFGQALAKIGYQSSQIVSLDAEVKNSTYAELFEKEHPERFIQAFVAEQNMVGMAIGCYHEGKIPFVSTFGAFFTRAFDQIRMAAVGSIPLRLVGSHVGVSIGQDGPSQMALEDIAMMDTIFDSVILYPCDAVSTFKLVYRMAQHRQSISYLRTTRMETPVLYDNSQDFFIGGCSVLRQSNHDIACIIAAGITLFEALKAYDQLLKENISVAVIDLYSIKPFDQKTVLQIAKKSQNKLIVVEDHYQQGGIGQIVSFAFRNTGITISSLAVTKMPRSGKPEELLAYENINSDEIIRAVKAL